LSRDGERLRVETGDRAVIARRVLIATGLRDELPDVPGLAARWGIDVLHCPNCHGWEVRDRLIGVLATGPMAVHQALLSRQLSPHVTLLQHTGPAVTDEQAEQLDALDICLVGGEVAEIEADTSRELPPIQTANRGGTPSGTGVRCRSRASCPIRSMGVSGQYAGIHGRRSESTTSPMRAPLSGCVFVVVR
jgi:hypothetical protein